LARFENPVRAPPLPAARPRATRDHAPPPARLSIEEDGVGAERGGVAEERADVVEVVDALGEQHAARRRRRGAARRASGGGVARRSRRRTRRRVVALVERGEHGRGGRGRRAAADREHAAVHREADDPVEHLSRGRSCRHASERTASLHRASGSGVGSARTPT